ncbi:hypothetical protein [Allorhodopirellula solitaria]|uniref:Uncharacterized protein n=1 Tax=Allorhodopirellula solitaria TaxID=2527987 RepID=A0A5C5YJH7_9BACT|nr:hypothetical protein [Allorhodopirellula solitaria]TWT75046.1 hypothetical protein CA85_03340 [Allorhodopirellula solitaria]
MHAKSVPGNLPRSEDSQHPVQTALDGCEVPPGLVGRTAYLIERTRAFGRFKVEQMYKFWIAAVLEATTAAAEG